MAMKNKYIERSKISEAKFREVVRLFCIDLTASQMAQEMGLNRNTVNRLVQGIRERIAIVCEAESPVSGEVEVDESYFGAKRVRGVRGRGAKGKTIVFGLFKRQGCVYTEIVPDCSKATLKVLFIRMAGEVIMASWIWGIRSITECSMVRMNLPMNKSY